MKRGFPPRHLFPFYYGWAIVGASFLQYALAIGVSNSQGVFLKPLLADFGWTRAMLAGAFAAATLTAGILAPLMGLLSDRYGPRILLALSGLFTGGTYLLVSQLGALWQFYLTFALVMGLGNSARWGSIGPTITRWFVAKRGLAQGIVHSGAGLGNIFMPPLATYLILTYSWRTTYLLLGLLLVISLVSLSLIYRRSPQDMGLLPDGKAGPATKQNSSEVSKTKPRADTSTPHISHTTQISFTLRQALATRSFRLLAFAAVASSFTQSLVLVHLVPLATDKGFSPTIAATFLSASGVSNILGKITMGLVSDRIGRRNSLIISFSLAAGMLFWLITAQDAWALYLFAAIYGFAYGSWIPMFPAIAGDLFGLAALGSVYGMIASCDALGGTLGPIVAGYIFDITHSYNYAFLTAAVLLIAGIVALLPLRLPKK